MFAVGGEMNGEIMDLKATGRENLECKCCWELEVSECWVRETSENESKIVEYRRICEIGQGISEWETVILVL
ncbi:hypothetical protein VNO77_08925 [Canavalia gladiata]|uniref:Uncharacterized protein n=1 Tax=Canavalia gladiata TaxID=3824 RepID=A0AAN9QWS6_CANGL